MPCETRASTKRKSEEALEGPRSKSRRTSNHSEDVNIRNVGSPRAERDKVDGNRLQSGKADLKSAGADKVPTQNVKPANIKDAIPSEPKIRARNDTPTKQKPDDPARSLNKNDNHNETTRAPQTPDKAKTAAEGNKKPNEEERKRFQQKLHEAHELIDELVLLMEWYHHDKSIDKDAKPSERQQTHRTKVCTLANQQDMYLNPFLKALGFNWFTGMERLHKFRAQIEDSEEEYRRRLDEWTQACRALDSAILKRTAKILAKPSILFVDPNTTTGPSWNDTVRKQDDAVSTARQAVEKAEGLCNVLRERIQDSWREENSMQEFSMQMAETALISIGLLQPYQTAEIEAPKEDVRNGVDPQPRKNAGLDSTRSAQRSRRKSRSESKRSAHRSRKRARSQSKQSAHQATPRSDDCDDDRPRALIDIAQEESRKQLKDARRIRSVASRNRRAYRDNYNQGFVEFLQAKKDGLTFDTRSEWDRYRLKENKRAHLDAKIADIRLEFAKMEAREMGIVRKEEMTSNYGDWTDDGYEEVDSQMDDLIWELKKEEIEAWRTDEQQRDIAGQSHWQAAKSECEPGGSSSESGFGQSPGDIAEGKDKERLDDWKAHQEVLRNVFVGLPDKVIIESRTALWSDEGRCCCG